MRNRLSSEFEIEVFEHGEFDIDRLIPYLTVYHQHYYPTHRTDTNELIYFITSPSIGRRVIYFGLSFRGNPCGFCTLMIYSKNIGIIDFIVISPDHRGHGTFFEFSNLISDYLFKKSIILDYVIVEIIKNNEPLSTKLTPKILIRLLSIINFEKIDISYFSPSPLIIDSLRKCESILMIRTHKGIKRISKSEILYIVDTIYRYHYLNWYETIMPREKFRPYKRILLKLLSDIKIYLSNIDEIDVIKLDQSLDVFEQSENKFQFIYSIIVTIATFATIFAALSSQTISTFVLILIALLAVILSRISQKIKIWLIRFFDQK